MTDVPSSGPPRLTVVVCSYNGAAGVDRVLAALARTSLAEALDVVLVDDGSTDGSAEVGRRHGVRVISHPSNRGLGAARNTGLAAVVTDLVAYLDDDCEPAPDWAYRILGPYVNESTMAVGGAVVPRGTDGFIAEYMVRNNPFEPLGLDLAVRSDIPYRFARYLARTWRRSPRSGQRQVYSILGGNMSFRTNALRKVGGFDASMRFGSEDLDVCMRIRAAFGDECLVFEPTARVFHHFKPGLNDALRRSRAYGRGHPRMLAKHPEMRPTIFPLPIATLGLLAFSLRRPKVALAVAVLPHAVHPRGLLAFADGEPQALLDPYVTLLQEAAFDIGVLDGLRQARSGGGWCPRPATKRL